MVTKYVKASEYSACVELSCNESKAAIRETVSTEAEFIKGDFLFGKFKLIHD